MASSDNPLQDPRDDLIFAFHETTFRKVFVATAGIALKLFMVIRVDGLENLPEQGGCIIAANHLSNFDVFPMQLSLSRPLFFMGKSELFSNPLLSWFYRNLGAFPVHRGASDQWAMNHCRKVLDKGLILAMFPEGTRSRGKGLSVAKTGAARLAIEKQVPVIPMALVGTNRIFDQFPRRGHVQISISEPILPTEDDDPLSLTDRVMFALAFRLPETMRGAYAEVPPEFT